MHKEEFRLFFSLLRFCQSDHPPVCLSFLSFPVSSDSSITPLIVSVLAWLRWQLLGRIPSQCSAPSWPLERRLHSFSRWTGPPFFPHAFSPTPLTSKVYFALSLTCCNIFSLFFTHTSPFSILLLRSWRKQQQGWLLMEAMRKVLLEISKHPVGALHSPPYCSAPWCHACKADPLKRSQTNSRTSSFQLYTSFLHESIWLLRSFSKNH